MDRSFPICLSEGQNPPSSVDKKKIVDGVVFKSSKNLIVRTIKPFQYSCLYMIDAMFNPWFQVVKKGFQFEHKIIFNIFIILFYSRGMEDFSEEDWYHNL